MQWTEVSASGQQPICRLGCSQRLIFEHALKRLQPWFQRRNALEVAARHLHHGRLAAAQCLAELFDSTQRGHRVFRYTTGCSAPSHPCCLRRVTCNGIESSVPPHRTRSWAQRHARQQIRGSLR